MDATAAGADTSPSPCRRCGSDTLDPPGGWSGPPDGLLDNARCSREGTVPLRIDRPFELGFRSMPDRDSRCYNGVAGELTPVFATPCLMTILF